MPSSPPEPLPLGALFEALPLTAAPETRPERADAALNRQRILCAAAQLFNDRGIDQVTMHDVARAAQVGVGTLYRRFGDRSGLALAILDEAERAFQERIIRGEPPLGPGAPAADRLRAFGVEYVIFVDEHVEILAAAGPFPTADGPWSFYRTHLRLLLEEAAPGVDAEYATEALATSLVAPLHLHLRRARGWPLDRLQAGWATHVDAWLALAARG